VQCAQSARDAFAKKKKKKKKKKKNASSLLMFFMMPRQPAERSRAAHAPERAAHVAARPPRAEMSMATCMRARCRATMHTRAR